MTEADLKGRLVKEFSPQALVFRHEDYATAGIPDISVTLFGRTTWWEAKHCNPSLKRDPRQEFTMQKMARMGYARYVIYHETINGNRRTLIVHPNDIMIWQNCAEVEFAGFAHSQVAQHIQKIHESMVCN